MQMTYQKKMDETALLAKGGHFGIHTLATRSQGHGRMALGRISLGPKSGSARPRKDIV
jgi:hypothetical protein